MALQFQVMGPPRLVDEAGRLLPLPPGKPMAVLAALACGDRPWSRSELADLLWRDSERGRARQSVRQALWFLRSRVGADVISGDDPVTVTPGRLVTDRSGFLEGLRTGRLEEAASLWRGPFLEGLSVSGGPAWDAWVEEVRDDLVTRYRSALQAAAGSARDPAAALPWLRRAALIAPPSVEAWITLVEAALEARLPQVAQEALAEARALWPEGDGEGRLDRAEARVTEAVQTQEEGGHGARPVLELVGRTRELQQLSALWRRSRDGEGQVVVLSGPGGIGKTRLADELCTSVRVQGGQVVRVRGHRGESRIPWGIAADLVRQLLEAPGAAAVSPGSDTLLRALVPALVRDGGSHPSRPERPEPVALAEAFVDLLLNVAYEEPTLLVMDDLHWGDAESRALVLRACRHLSDAACMTVLVDRRAPARGSSRTADLDAVLERSGTTCIVLPPLREVEVADALGRAVVIPGTTEASRISSRLHRVTQGNPLFLHQLLGRLVDDGILQRSPEDGWVLDPARLPDDLPLPESARRLVMDRLHRLSPEAASLAEALARHPGPASPGVLQGRAGLEAATFRSALAELRTREVVVPAEAGALDFGHDLLREAAAMGARTDGLAETSGAAYRPAPGVRWWPAAAALLAASILLAIRPGSPSGPLPEVGPALPGEPGALVLRPGTSQVVGVLVREDPEGLPGYELLLQDLGTGESTLLYRSLRGFRGPAAWSADGTRLAFVVRGPADTLVTLSSRGDELSRAAPAGTGMLAVPGWCPDGGTLAVLAGEAGALHPHLLHPGAVDLAPLEGAPAAGTGVLCVGEGPRVVYRGEHQGRTVLLETAPGREGATPLETVEAEAPDPGLETG